MAKVRLTQHKAKRDEAKVQETVQLKRENSQLKRKVKRLEKEVDKKLALAADAVETGLEEDGGVLFRETLKDVLTCPDCTSDSIRQIVLLGHLYHVCKDCGFRERKD
jgi:predicted Zn-ribbon and HTH transcriptional regulator